MFQLFGTDLLITYVYVYSSLPFSWNSKYYRAMSAKVKLFRKYYTYVLFGTPFQFIDRSWLMLCGIRSVFGSRFYFVIAIAPHGPTIISGVGDGAVVYLVDDKKNGWCTPLIASISKVTKPSCVKERDVMMLYCMRNMYVTANSYFFCKMV